MKHLFSKLLNNRWFYYRKAVVFQSALKKNVQQTAANSEWETIFPASLEHVQNLEGFGNLPKMWQNQFADRLASEVYQLFVIRSGNQLAYFSWITQGNESDLYLDFESHSVSTEPYLFHCFTREEFRGKGLHQYATAYLMNYCLEMNHFLWGIVYAENSPAIKAWEKAGMKKIGEVNSVGIFNLKWSKYFVNH
jgi:hypothetical protein